MNDLADLPDDVVNAILDKPRLRGEQLDTLARLLIAKRDEAIAFRRSSGAEDVWLYCEEAYLGIDDANRSEFANAKWAKPTSINGPVTTNQQNNRNDGKSTIYVRMTSRYVDAGTAKVCEILLPIDDKAFSLKPTPIPDLVDAKEDDRQLEMNGVPLEKTAEPGEAASPDGTSPLTVKDLAKEKLEKAADRAKKAETRIFDWMVEGGFRPEMRKTVFDMTRIGTGVLKAPYPEERTNAAFNKTPEGGKLTIVKEVKPTNRHVDPWNLYPSPGCGERLKNASYIFEVDYFSEAMVEALKKQPGYLKDQIEKALELGPGKDQEDSQNPHRKNNKDEYKVWYFHGKLTKKDFEAMNAEQFERFRVGKAEKDNIDAIVTMINDIPVKAVLTVLESGELPYHECPWQRRAGQWWGVGVAEQLKAPQAMVNAATRAMLNNAAKSAGSLIVLDTNRIQPVDKSWTLYPDKIFGLANDGVTEDIRNMMNVFQIPNMTPQLMSIVEYAFRLAEESTSIPLITQGQSGPTSPDTFGAAQLQNNNANQLLRSIGFQVDEYITEPVVRQYYEWLLLDPDVPEDEKGDWVIKANGSSALVERAIQDQFISQIGQLVMNPAFGVDPEKWFEQFMRSKRLDPRDVQYTEEQKKKMQSQPAPPPPQVQAAQIRAESDQKIAESRASTDQMRIKTDTDRDAAFQESLNERARIQAEANERELALKKELAIYKENSDLTRQLNDIKAKMAALTMELAVQKELAQGDNAPQVATPPTEPPGRAPDGEAYQA